MRILKNQPMIQQLSQTIANNELSNIAMVLETPTIMAEWFPINVDLSVTLDGYQNYDELIGPDSQIVFDYVDNLPLLGPDDLMTQAEYDEEVGYDENYQSSCVIYPNTIFPIPGSCFMIKGSAIPAIYVVTDIKPVTVRSNPFIEVSFKLFSRSPDKIAQLRRQVHDEYTTCLSALGPSKSLVIKKTTLDDINYHVKSYIEVALIYRMLFYDREKAAFVFEGLPDPVSGNRACYVDMTLWKFIFDERIIAYDSIIDYANNNGLKTVDRIYTGSPDIMVDEHTFRRSIIWRLYTQDKRDNFDTYRYPDVWFPSPQITKYQGQNIWYLENYLNNPASCSKYGAFYLWDDEFLCRIRNNDPYEEIELRSGVCDGCSEHCTGKPVQCYNPYLRNVIIRWYNGEEIDWDNVSISDDKTIENYYLIPLFLGIYKQYIQGLQG